MSKTKYYQPGTRINLNKVNDEYYYFVKISNYVYNKLLPLVAIYFLIDLALVVNGF